MSTGTLSSLHARWEQEFFAGHRWGRLPGDERVTAKHARLRDLWQAIPPDAPVSEALLNQIIALEFCNWRAGMPVDGGSRAERRAANERYLPPIAAWLEHTPPADAFAEDVHRELGVPTPAKRFLAALLVSPLRSQLSGSDNPEDTLVYKG